MIQRIQSVWLFLATALSGSTFQLPFYSGDWLKDKLPNTMVPLYAQTTLTDTILTIITALIALAAIFLYKNRKLQLKVTYTGLVMALGLLVYYFIQTTQFKHGGFSPWSVLYFAIIICLLLAARGINKDEKIIKSMDRFR